MEHWNRQQQNEPRNRLPLRLGCGSVSSGLSTNCIGANHPCHGIPTCCTPGADRNHREHCQRHSENSTNTESGSPPLVFCSTSNASCCLNWRLPLFTPSTRARMSASSWCSRIQVRTCSEFIVQNETPFHGKEVRQMLPTEKHGTQPVSNPNLGPSAMATVQPSGREGVLKRKTRQGEPYRV